MANLTELAIIFGIGIIGLAVVEPVWMKFYDKITEVDR